MFEDYVPVLTGAAVVGAVSLALLGLRGRKRSRKLDDLKTKLTGKTAIVTGANTVREFAKQVTEKEQRLDILVNNAGVFSGLLPAKPSSDQGLDMTMTVNYLGPYLLTRLLTAPSRIINVSSEAQHYPKQFCFDSLCGKKALSDFSAYALSKLGNLLFTRELAERLADSGELCETKVPRCGGVLRAPGRCGHRDLAKPELVPSHHRPTHLLLPDDEEEEPSFSDSSTIPGFMMMAGTAMDQTLYIPTNGMAESSHRMDFVNGASHSPPLVLEKEALEDRLEFADNARYASNLLVAMGNLRRQNQFCDAVLRVGEREVSIHRAVVAASSPYLFELFERSSADSNHMDHGMGMFHGSSMYKLKDVSFSIFSYLLDYMYSGRLSVGAQDVGEVYRTAKLLRMEQAAQACSAFLVDHLTPANCLGIRMLSEDLTFRAGVDSFIQANMKSVIDSKHFFGLPELKVEIVGAEEAMENGGQQGQLFHLVLDWARASVDKSKPKVELLTEEVNVLYLNAENHLQDCKDVDDSRMSDDDVVVDYKKHSRRRSTLSNKKSPVAAEQQLQKSQVNGMAMPFHIFNISPEGGVAEKEWSIIATIKQKGNSYMALAVLSGKMMAVSIHLRQVASPGSPPSQGELSPAASSTGERCATLQPLAAMSSSRCAFGVCVWNDSFVVCGGYDRGECLVSVEMYTPSTGRWAPLPSMLTPRARFGAAALRGRLYAIGGCDGSRDLDSVHCLSFQSLKWEVAAPLKTARSSVGVAEVCGQVYCVGGSDGQRSLKTCEVYDVDTNRWAYIAPLNTARSQASVSSYRDCLIAVGGTDSWNCLSSVEMYQPSAKTWTCIAGLGTLRRGAGIDVVQDSLWVVGGSDGVSSLRSTEVYDAVSQTWNPGPPLNTPRANVSAVGLQGVLYAVGGFSGKKFLNSLEILQPGSAEWGCYQPGRRRHRASRIGSADSSGDEVVSASNGSLAVHSDSDVSTSDHETNSADEAR
ncbi:uncharacterized protein LOC143289409 [Babylonia areolata]|uniref:uncharacterized protein LOC143289409 n=1 Tax=Babylonia areolata TaxID=304850 RepID=UPI003FCF10E8